MVCTSHNASWHSKGGSVNTPRRILLVDDEEDVLNTTSRALTGRFGGQVVVTTANDAEEAIICCMTVDFDLVVSDVNLPGANGVKLANYVLQAKRAPSVILVSGRPRPADIPAGVRFLGKPYLFAEIAAEIRLALGIEPITPPTPPAVPSGSETNK